MSDSCKQTIREKLKKFLSVKFVAYLISLAAMVLVSIYGELNATFVSGLGALYAALVAGNAVSKRIRAKGEVSRARVSAFMESREGPADE